MKDVSIVKSKHNLKLTFVFLKFKIIPYLFKVVVWIFEILFHLVADFVGDVVRVEVDDRRDEVVPHDHL
jgi:hypothetical protein